MTTVADLLSGQARAAQAPPAQGASVAPLPAGFELDTGSPPPPPPGFQLQTGAPSRTGADHLKMGMRDVMTGAGQLVDVVGGPANTLVNMATGSHLRTTPGQDLANSAADAMGLPAPQTNAEKMRAAIIGGATAGLTTAGVAGLAAGAEGTAGNVAQMLASRPLVDTALSAESGAASETVRQNGGGPLAQFAAGMAAPVATHVVVSAAPAALSAARSAADGLTAGVSPAAAERAAGAKIAGAATDPAAAKASLEQPGELVPGSQPTTFQQTGDPGLGGLEREVMTRNQPAFQERAGQQNAARVQALGDIQQGADPNDVATTLRQHFDALDAQHEAAIDTATKAAQAKAADFGGNLPADQYGQVIRDAMAAGKSASSAGVSGFFDAIDPEQRLTGNVQETKLGAAKIFGPLAEDQRTVPAAEAGIFERAMSLPDITPVSRLIGLRQDLNALARDPSIAGTPTSARLTQLRQVIDSNLANSIAEKVANDDAAVQSGRLAPDDALGAWIRRTANEQLGTQAGGPFGARASASAGMGEAARRGGDGTDSPQGGISGRFAGGPGLSAADGALDAARSDIDAWRGTSRPSLFDAIRQLGGMKLSKADGSAVAGPDVEAAMTDVSRPGVINNRGGMAPEAMAQALADRGWFGHGIDDPSGHFEAALTDEAHGNRVFHPDSAPPADARIAALERELGEAGISAADRPGDAAAKLAAHREAARALYAKAERFGVRVEGRRLDDVLSDVAEREAIQEDSRSPEEQEFDRLSRGSLRPTFDEAARQRLVAANAASAEHHGTWSLPAIKSILAKDGNGNFKMSDGRVGAAFFHPGASGFEHMQHLLKASPQSLAAIADYAATSLRRIPGALKEDGSLDPAKFEAWRKAHEDALRALPDAVKARFADAASAGQALADAKAARVAALKEAQAGAIGRVMKLTEPEDVTRAVGSILNGRTAVADMKQLALATKGDANARAGLRQAVANHIATKLLGNTEVGTSGVTAIKGDAFQTFMKTAKPALHLVFSPEEVRTMEAIAEDIQRSNRTINSKPAGTPGSAHDVLAGLKAGGHGKSMLDMMGVVIGEHAHGPVGAIIGGVGVHLIQALHGAGVSRVDQLVTKAMLDPALARELLKKAPAKVTPASLRPLAVALARSPIGAQAQGDNRR